jgi:hypothetical protein
MSIIAHPLTKEEFPAWDKLVASSPQAGLFHTTAWNQMLCETAPQGQEWTQLVCENKGTILGGIALHYWRLAGKIQAPVPLFGYNGPVLDNTLHYEEQYKTIPGYETIQELIKGIANVSDFIAVRNQPEIWDVRAYFYNRWKIETRYTHILSCKKEKEAWSRIDAAFQEKISNSQYSISADTKDAQIQEFSLHASKKADPACPPQETRMEVLKKRIYWMKEREISKLVTLIDKNGTEAAIALFILSRQNWTIYLDQIFPRGKNLESDVLPHLIWHSFSLFGEKFEYMDLGISADMSISKLKDKLGGKLAPIHITRYQKK